MEMRKILILLFFFTFVFFSCESRAEETPIEEDEEDNEPEEKIVESPYVHIITDANFEESFTNTPNWLVEFYAPWCGHCKDLIPKFIESAKNNKNPNVKSLGQCQWHCRAWLCRFVNVEMERIAFQN